MLKGNLGNLAVLILTLAVLGGFCIQQVTDVDYWWQLSTGREVAAHGPPRAETLMTSIRGTPRIEPDWLYCFSLFHLVSFVNGPWLVILLKATAFVAAFALIALAIRAARKPLATLAILVGVLAVSHRTGLRPEVLCWFLLAVFLFLLERRNLPPVVLLVGLPVLQVVWSNTHSMAVMGPALVLLRCALDVLRLLRIHAVHPRLLWALRGRFVLDAILLALVLAAWLVNPYGLALPERAIEHFGGLSGLTALLHTRRGLDRTVLIGVALVIAVVWLVRTRRSDRLLFGRTPHAIATRAALAAVTGAFLWFMVHRRAGSTPPVGAIVELLPTFRFFSSNLAIPAFAVLLAGFVVVMMVAPPRRSGFWIVAALVGAVPALLAVRAVPLFVLPATVVVGRALWAVPFSGRAGTIVRTSLATASLVLLGALLSSRLFVSLGDDRHFGLSVACSNDPRALGEFLDRVGPFRRVLNSHRLGGYLGWKGVPLSVDSRAHGEILTRNQETMARIRAGHATRPRIGRFDAVFLDPDELEEVGGMGRLPGWRLVFADHTAIVFVPDAPTSPPPLVTDDLWLAATLETIPNPVSKAGVSGALHPVWSALPHQRLGRACLALERPRPAGILLDIARSAQPRLFRDDAPLSYALLAQRRYAESMDAAARGLARRPHDPALLRMATLGALAAGELDIAAERSRTLLAHTPADPDALLLAGVTALRRDENTDAADLLTRAAAARPEHPDTLANLGAALLRTGRAAEAVDALARARRLDPTNRTTDAVLRDALRAADPRP